MKFVELNFNESPQLTKFTVNFNESQQNFVEVNFNESQLNFVEVNISTVDIHCCPLYRVSSTSTKLYCRLLLKKSIEVYFNESLLKKFIEVDFNETEIHLIVCTNFFVCRKLLLK